MKARFNSLVTLRLNNSNNLKYCDIRLNSAKRKILYTKSYDAGKLVEYKTDNYKIQNSNKTGFPVLKVFENAKTKIIRDFHENSAKLRRLLMHNKGADEKYIATFDRNENIRELMIGYPKTATETVFEDDIIKITGKLYANKPELSKLFLLNKQTNQEFMIEEEACKETLDKLSVDSKNMKTSTVFKIDENGNVISVNGKSVNRDIVTVKYDREKSLFELSTSKHIKEDTYGIYSEEEKLYLGSLNNKLKVYDCSEYKDSGKEIKSVRTYTEKNGQYNLIEDLIYDSKTNNILLHEIRNLNDEVVYLAVDMSDDTGYRLCGDYNLGKTINIVPSIVK